MFRLWIRIYEVLCQLLDLLADATFLFFWGLANWLLFLGVRYFHASGIVLAVLWVAQGIFAGFTLAIIALHLFRDLRGSTGRHSGLRAVWEKIGDMANHLLALIITSTLLIGWSLINSGLHVALTLIPGESLSFITFSEKIAELFVGVATLWKVVKPMYKHLIEIYYRLFP